MSDQITPNPTLLTVDQTAAKLQISRSAVYSLVEHGKLVCHRIGVGRGTIRISHDDLNAYLESCRTTEVVEELKPPRRTRLKHIRLR